jgi:hypothetical protein
MLVDIFLHESCIEMVEKSSDEMKYVLSAQIEELQLWADRRCTDVANPDRADKKIGRVVNLGSGKVGTIEEIRHEYWDVEGANKRIWKDLDRKIVEVFKVLKLARWERPSVVLLGGYFRFIHHYDQDDKWQGNLKLWTSAMLVYQRLKSTARVLARHEHHEKFGPMKRVTEDGVEYLYGPKPWKKELSRRGMGSSGRRS